MKTFIRPGITGERLTKEAQDILSEGFPAPMTDAMVDLAYAAHSVVNTGECAHAWDSGSFGANGSEFRCRLCGAVEESYEDVEEIEWKWGPGGVRKSARPGAIDVPVVALWEKDVELLGIPRREEVK